MDSIPLLVLVVGGILGITFLIQYLKKRKLIDAQTLESIQQAIMIAELISKSLKLNEKDRINSEYLISMVKLSTKYVDKMFTTLNKEDKIALGISAVEEVYKQFGKVPSDSDKRLIAYFIEKGINEIEKLKVK